MNRNHIQCINFRLHHFGTDKRAAADDCAAFKKDVMGNSERQIDLGFQVSAMNCCRFQGAIDSGRAVDYSEVKKFMGEKVLEESVLGLIRVRYNTLSPTQKKIADYILTHSSDVILSSLSSLAQTCGTSETTVLRFLRKLDHDSYQVFKVRIAQELSAESTASVYEQIGPKDDIGEVGKKVIRMTADAVGDLSSVLDTSQMEALSAALKKAQRIFFIGVGASGMIAADAGHKFLRLGMHVGVYNDSHMMSIQCAHASKGDLIVAFSHSGESREILDAIKLAKENGAQTAAVTSYARSSLSKLADILVLSSSKETAYRSDAMVSRILQMVIIDILYVSTVLKIGPEGIKRLNASRIAVAKKKT